MKILALIYTAFKEYKYCQNIFHYIDTICVTSVFLSILPSLYIQIEYKNQIND